MKKRTFLILFFVTSLFGYSQIKALYNQSVEAYKSKDYPLFLKLNKQMDSIRPSHPTVSYNLAAAYSLNKMHAEAIAALQRLIVMNNATAFEEDADFEFIKASTDYKKLVALKATQNNEIATSVEKLTLSEKDLHPESVLYLEKQKLWLASSIRNKKIVTFDSKGVCTDWFTDVLYSVFALKADWSQKYLWVSTSAMPVMKGFTKEMDGQNQILKIEISSKKVVKSYSMQGKHVFGDLVVARNGDIYISDSVEPLIYKIADDKLFLWKDLKGEAFNLQGLTFNNDESKLFVADYLKGVCVISMKDTSSSWLQFPEGTTKKGIDGLVHHKNTLIAVQNGSVPIRIVKYQLNTDNNQIVGFTVLDNNREIFNEPALATVSKGKLYFFANSPWKFYNAQNELDLTKFENPKLFELQLD
ncbi:MAG: hypothetical protein V4648_00505 [Bacteroidota bacterium]